jgi:peptidyl-prolyl cis-trans isomerase C
MRFLTVLFVCPLFFVMAQTPPPPPPKAAPPAAIQFPPQPAAQPQVAPDKVVMSIGEFKITAEMFNQIIDSLPAQVQAAARGPNRKEYAENLAKIFVLAQEGKRRKLDETPAFKLQTMFQNSNMLAGKTYEQLGKETSPSEPDLRKYYEEHAAEFEQIKARHILIRMKGSPVPVRAGKPDLTDEEAAAKIKEVQKKLAAGGEFAALAAEESDDPTSGSNGGELGQFKRNSMVPAFEEAAFKLKPGEVSEPVKTQFGYHLIKVDSRQNSFEDAKSDLERRLKPEMAQKAVADLEKKSNVVYDPEFFGTPKPKQ